MEFRVFKQVPRIIYGDGSVRRLRELLPPDTKDGVLVIDSSIELSICEIIDGHNLQVIKFDAKSAEPYTSQVDELVNNINNSNKIEFVIGIGGGSTMDVAKSISICLRNEVKSETLQGWDLVKTPGVYKVGIPTIFGSGSEASRTAVLNNGIKKQGINSDYSMFDAIILDPKLSDEIDQNTKFYTAMDCYIHCVESISGTMINRLSEGYAKKALEYCEEYFEGGMRSEDLICVGSYYGGVSIVNSEVGICHALSYGLSIEFGLRHGLANCVVFKVLEEYYGEYVNQFNSWLDAYDIVLPKSICANISEAKLDRMINQTMLMDRPLTNALGTNWRQTLTPSKIKELYGRM